MPNEPADGRLESWKEIANYLNRDIRTVQRWEKSEGLPVHRHLHEKQASVHAFKAELDNWRTARAAIAAQPAAVESTRTNRLMPVLAIAALLLAGIVFIRWLVRDEPVQPSKAVPFTTYPGDERNPTFSPRGDQLAFAWNGKRQDNFDIYVKQIGGADEPLRLTSDPSNEVCPAWSPDGRNIAFLRVDPSGNAKVLVTPALGGQSAREIAATVVRRLDDPYGYLAWSRDSKWIVWCQRDRAEDSCGLKAVSLESGEVQTLTSAPGSWAGDLEPAFSPDGRSLSFARMRQIGVEDLFTLPLDTNLKPISAPVQLTAQSIAGSSAWLPDGKQIIFSAGEYRGTRHLWRARADRGTPAQAEKLIEVGEDAVNVAASSWERTARLAYSREILDENVWQLDLTAARPEKPELLIASTRADYNPSYSPNGTRIAFVSNRSGSSEIWTCNRDGSQPVMLTSFAGKLTSNPKWSPDGQTIVFDSRAEDGKPRLYTVAAGGGPPKLLTADPGSEPTWSRDGKWIYFSSDAKGQPEIWKVRPEGGTPVQVTSTGGAYAIESPDGKFLYYSPRQYPRPVSLWRIPVEGGPAVKILDTLERHLNFTVAAQGIYFAEQPVAGAVSISFYRFATRAIERLASPAKPLSFGISLAPDGSRLLFSQIDQQGSDLMLVEKFR